jgi:hypothetical protein
MKTKFLLLVALTTSALFLSIYLRADPEWNLHEFMQRKLFYSQKVLEGLCTENFTLIRENAENMRAMTDDKHFPDYKHEAYKAFMMKFQKSAKTLQEAAINKDLDGAVYAYHDVTVSCVECHRWVRGQDVGKYTPLTMPEVEAYPTSK